MYLQWNDKKKKKRWSQIVTTLST